MRIPVRGSPDPPLVRYAATTRFDGFFIPIAFWRRSISLHTAVWTMTAGSILALPATAFTGHFRWALLLTAFVVCECAVLAANRGRCRSEERRVGKECRSRWSPARE